MTKIIPIKPIVSNQKPDISNVTGGKKPSDNLQEKSHGLRNNELLTQKYAEGFKINSDLHGFDSAKVERIKKAIVSGNYPINSRRLAQNFTNLERLIS